MKYFSTRGDKTAKTSAETIVKGIADDGGLYVPESIPQIEKISPDLDYNAHAIEIMQHFITDFTPVDIERCVVSAYNSINFTSQRIAPVYELPHVSILELFHGKTLAFKDMALSILPRLMRTSLKKTKNFKTQVILTATSGDTGVSAIEGFKNIDDTKIIVFYPESGVSVIQKQHMITQTGDNVHVIGVKGNFDDAQSEVKRLFLDEKLNAQLERDNYELSSANSINTGRLIPQIVYYFYAYSQLVLTGMSYDTPVNFVVPTGNFGNILAGYYAKQMGLPINKLICASNENKVLFDFFETGTFDSNRPFHVTTSPSMDILIPSNFERLVHALDGSVDKLNALSNKDKFTMAIPEDFVGFYASEQETAETIKDVYKNHKYLLDPHTAVAYTAYKKYARPEEKTVIISTASPYKFPKTVMTSINSRYDKYDDYALLVQMSEMSRTEVPAPIRDIKRKDILHDKVVEISEMKDTVLEILKN